MSEMNHLAPSVRKSFFSSFSLSLPDDAAGVDSLPSFPGPVIVNPDW